MKHFEQALNGNNLEKIRRVVLRLKVWTYSVAFVLETNCGDIHLDVRVCVCVQFMIVNSHLSSFPQEMHIPAK